MTNSVLENEEDVKFTIVEWLAKSTDLRASISLEKSFTLRVGRGVFKFDSEKQIKNAQGRCDVLVKCGDRNLLVAEIKHPDKELTDGDRDQGCSYACLLYPPAPYVLVTNGREHRLYNSLTRKLVDPKLLTIDNISLTLPDDLLAEAQEMFFRLNDSNLSQFCKSQCESALALIEGSLADNKKHVPELKVDRANVRTTITKFIESDKSSLTFLGHTGSGKTCELASVVHYLQGINLNCLFFNGSRIESTLQNEISNTYDWTFSDSESASKIVKRLAKLGRKNPIIVVVDGIDEITVSNVQKEIENILTKTQSTCLKFIFSCKFATFPKFTQISQLPTEIINSGETYELKELNNTEFKSLIKKYDNAFGIEPTYGDEFTSIAKKNLFILRLMYQIAADSGIHDLNLNSNDILDKYIDQQLDKCSDRIGSGIALNMFANHVYNNGRSAFKLFELSAATPPIMSDTAFNDLAHNGLLTLDKRNSASYSVSFNFEQIQSYVIAYNVLSLNEKSTDEIQAIIDEFQYGSIQDTVINYYYANSSTSHREVFEGNLRARANSYLRLHDGIVGRHLEAIETKLEPRGSGVLGMVLQLDVKKKKPGGYGFRRASNDRERVVFIPTNLKLSNTRHALYDQGVSVYVQGACPLVNSITKDAIISHRDFYGQTLDLAFEGDLDEGVSTAMLSEKIMALIDDSSEGFGAIQDKLDRMESVRLDDITRHLLKRRLNHYYEQDYIDQNIISKQPVVNGKISFTFNRTDEYIEWLNSTVENAMKTGDYPDVLQTHIDLDRLTEELASTIELLKAHGIGSLQPSILYSRYSEIKRNAIANKDLAELGALVAEMHNERRDIYEIFLNANFPTLSKNLGSEYNNDDIFITLEIYKKGPKSRDQIGLSYYHVDSTNGRSKFVGNEEIELLEYAKYMIHNGIKHTVKRSGHTSLEHFIECRGDLNSRRFGDWHMRRGVYADMHKALTNIGEDRFKDLISAN